MNNVKKIRKLVVKIQALSYVKILCKIKSQQMCIWLVLCCNYSYCVTMHGINSVKYFLILNFSLFTIQINHQPDATIFQFIILTFIYSLTCFRRSPAHHQELNDCSSSLWFCLRIVVIAVLCSWSGRLSPRYEGKTRGCYCSHRAPDDG